MPVIQGERIITDPEQVVLESDPFRRLSYTWHSFAPEWARADGLSDEEFAAVFPRTAVPVSFDL